MSAWIAKNRTTLVVALVVLVAAYAFYYLKGDIALKAGKKDEATTALREAIQLDPDDAEIQEKLAAVSFIEEDAPSIAEPEPVASSEPEPEPVPALEPIHAMPEPIESAGEALPLESFFEELRDKVAREQETRAREQLEREKS